MIVLRLLLLPGGLGSSAALARPLGCHGAAFTMIRMLVVAALGALAPELAAPPPVGLQRHGLEACPACPMQLPKPSHKQLFISQGRPHRPLGCAGALLAAGIQGAGGGGTPA